MRLIDVDELIKAIEQGEGFSWDSHGNDDLCVRKKYIDNAPTVDTTCPHCDSGYAQGLSDGYLKGKEERPQGKWEEDWQEDLDFMSRKGWKCPFCKWRTTYGKSNFCMNCGADMRGGKASD